MRLLYTILFFFLGVAAVSQSIVPLKGDSIIISKTGGYSNLVVRNSTKDSLNGLMLNIGNGVTKFIRIRAINDSQFIVGTDTVTLRGGIDQGGVGGPTYTAGNGVRLDGTVFKLSNSSAGGILTDDVYWDGHTGLRRFDILANQIFIDVKDYTLFQSNTVDSGYTEMKNLFKIYSEVYGDVNTPIFKNYSGATLPEISANRTATFPILESLKRGILLYVNNKNTSAFSWLVAGAILKEPSGASITSLANSTFYQFMWDGTAWVRMNTIGSTTTGTVTNIATTWGLYGGPITSTGTLGADSSALTSRGWHKKSIDSLALLLGTGTVTNIITSSGITGGPITTTGTLKADTALLNTRARLTKSIDSLALLLGSTYTFSSGVFNTAGAVKADSALLSTRARLTKSIDSLALLITATNGTVTSVATGFGLAGGTITTTGTIIADTSLVTSFVRTKKVADSLGLLIIPYTFSNGVFNTAGAIKADTALLNSRARLTKSIDSLALLLTAGTVTNIATSSGITGGPITATGTLKADTALLNTRARLTKSIDSLALLLGSTYTFSNGVYNTAGVVKADSALMGSRARVQKGIDSLALLIITGSDGGTVTNVATSFGLTGGPITVTGTLKVDSAAMATRARVQKAVDSLAGVLGGALVVLSNAPAPGFALINFHSVFDTTKAKRLLPGLFMGMDSTALTITSNLDTATAGPWVRSQITAGTGTVTNVATSYGLTGGPITVTGTLKADSAALATRARLTKSIDSLALISTGTGTVTSIATSSGITGGTITTTGTLKADTALLSTRLRLTKSIDSLALLLTNGTVTSIATGYGLAGGTITTTGTLVADTFRVTSRLWYKKGIDSLALLLGTGTVTSIATQSGITGGTITGTGTLKADTALLATRARVQKAVDSMTGAGSGINIYNSDGSLTGTRTVDIGDYLLNFSNGDTYFALLPYNYVSNSSNVEFASSIDTTYASRTNYTFVANPSSAFAYYNLQWDLNFFEQTYQVDNGNTYLTNKFDNSIPWVYYQHGDNDSNFTIFPFVDAVADTFLYHNLETGQIERRPSGGGGGGGSGTVTSVADGFGIYGGPITTTGTLSADSAALSTRARLTKSIDSLALAKTYTASNGLTMVANNTKLGGTIINNTNLTLPKQNLFEIATSDYNTWMLIKPKWYDANPATIKTYINYDTSAAANITNEQTQSASVTESYNSVTVRRLNNGVSDKNNGTIDLSSKIIGFRRNPSFRVIRDDIFPSNAAYPDSAKLIFPYTGAKDTVLSYNVLTGAFERSLVSGGGGSGTVTNIATSSGITGGPITTTGTLKADTALLSTRARLTKSIDSLALLIVGGSGSVTSIATASGITGGTITTTGTLKADTALLATRTRVKKSIDSLALLLTGGTVTSVAMTVPAGLSVSGSPITTAGTFAITTTLNGILRGTGSGFATTTIAAPLSFSGTTLSIPVATSGANGYLSSANWTTFNNKQNALQFKDEGVNVGTAGAVTNVDFTGAGITASYLSGTLTINVGSGGSGTVTNVATGFGLTGGPITTTGTLKADSASMATRARVQKAIDSLSLLSGVYAETGSVGPATFWAFAHDQSTGAAADLTLRVGHLTNNNLRTITVNVVTYILNSNFNLNTWTVVGTIPSGFRPNNVINGMLPNTIDCDVYENAAGTDMSGIAVYGAGARYRIMPSGIIQVYVPSVTGFAVLGGLDYVLTPVHVTYFFIPGA